MSRSVLIISYFFPPVGGAGVQRVTKFVKYLPKIDWQPVVLTTLNPSVPLFDETLVADIPESVQVIRARTLEPDYAAKKAVSASSAVSGSRFNPVQFLKSLLRKIVTELLQPDPQILWFPAAIRQGKKFIAQQRPDVIFVSAPPFSSLLVGAWLARKYSIPLVVDFRDEWDISNSVWENKRISRFSQRIQSRMQNYVIKRANAIIATTEMSLAALKAKASTINPDAIFQCIYNGFDAEDFKNRNKAQQSSDKYVLTYVGTLWNLTSIEPMVEALVRLSNNSPEILENLKLVIAGRRTADQENILTRLHNTSVEVELLDYLDHPGAIRKMLEANALLLLLGDYEFAGRVVPGKIFEYFATSNPIIAISPKGEVWELLDDYPLSSKASPSDIEGIAKIISELVNKFRSGEKCHGSSFDANRYERHELTKQLVNVFESLSETGQA